MIDFVKIELSYMNPEDLRNNSYLEFKSTLNERTGEISNKSKIAEYFGLKFIIRDDIYIEMQGSLHKYKNCGEHNYDRFTYLQLKEVLYDLVDKFGIDLKKSIIRNIEIGVNFKPPIKTKLILKNLLFHRSKPFKDQYVKKGDYRMVVHQRYCEKVYDKGLQYGLHYELIRYELQFKKMYDLGKMGINSLSDLLDQEKINMLKNLLLFEWDNTFLFDPTIQEGNLSKYNKGVKVHQWKDPSFWLDAPKHKKIKQKRLYQQIVSNHSDNLHQKIRELISDEYDQLMPIKDNLLTDNHYDVIGNLLTS